MQWPETTAAGRSAEGTVEAGDGRQAAARALAGARMLSESGALPGAGVLDGARALDRARARDRARALDGRSPAAFADLDLPCRGDPDLFFAELPDEVERAKGLCRGCPARPACFAGAVERREPCGVWGGELFVHGRVVPRKRPRGRPRKTEVAA